MSRCKCCGIILRVVGHPKNPDSDYCSTCKRASMDERPMYEYAHSNVTDGILDLFRNDNSEDND